MSHRSARRSFSTKKTLGALALGAVVAATATGCGDLSKFIKISTPGSQPNSFVSDYTPETCHALTVEQQLTTQCRGRIIQAAHAKAQAEFQAGRLAASIDILRGVFDDVARLWGKKPNFERDEIRGMDFYAEKWGNKLVQDAMAKDCTEAGTELPQLWARGGEPSYFDEQISYAVHTAMKASRREVFAKVVSCKRADLLFETGISGMFAWEDYGGSSDAGALFTTYMRSTQKADPPDNVGGIWLDKAACTSLVANWAKFPITNKARLALAANSNCQPQGRALVYKELWSEYSLIRNSACFRIGEVGDASSIPRVRALWFHDPNEAVRETCGQAYDKLVLRTQPKP